LCESATHSHSYRVAITFLYRSRLANPSRPLQSNLFSAVLIKTCIVVTIIYGVVSASCGTVISESIVRPTLSVRRPLPSVCLSHIGYYYSPVHGRGHKVMLRSVRPSVCSSVCLIHAPSPTMIHFRAIWLLQKTNRIHYAEVEPTGQRGPETAMKPSPAPSQKNSLG